MGELLQSIFGIQKQINIILIAIDQLNRSIKINSSPKRIISLVPSQTELLANLNLEKDVIGITKYCVHPNSWWISKQKVGGTKNLNLNKIYDLRPDLIIANKEENRKEDVELLMKKFPVWISDVKNLESAKDMIFKIGTITQKTLESKLIIENINKVFSSLNFKNPIRKKIAYLIWDKPIMTINNDTFINDIIEKIGFVNIFKCKTDRYPQISIDELKESNPDILFLSSEPFPYKKKHLDKYRILLPETKIELVNGEYFSWYGSRLQACKDYFSELQNKLLFD